MSGVLTQRHRGTEKRTLVDSGVAWIGKIPEGWKAKKIAALYDLRSEKCSDKEFKPLSVTMKGIVPQLEDVAKTNNGDDRKLVRAGDFVINSRSDRRGSCGISQLDGSVSLINTVLKPRDKMDPGYYNWVFHTSLFADEFYAWGHGIVDDLWTTRWSDMKSILVMSPPLAEQQRIAAFLDRECEKIDGLRGKIEKQIEKLDELKKSTITEAVTKGLKRGRKMKPSGVEWIGDIPEEWKVARVKHVTKLVTDGSHLSPDTENGVKDFISVVDLKDSGIDFAHSLKTSESNYAYCVATNCQPIIGDVLISKDGSVGKTYVVRESREFVVASSLVIMRPDEGRIMPDFLDYNLCADFIQSRLQFLMHGSALKRVSVSKNANLAITLPPLAEQKEIAEYLDKKCAAIDAAKEKCRVQLEKLAEYKKSLIYEYVTGKK